MLGKKSLAAVVVAAFIAAVPMAAYAAPINHVAAETSPSPDPTYAPSLHTTPSLDATAASACNNDRPIINFSIAMSDPDNLATSHDAVLIMSGSGNTTTIPLGTLGADNTLSGSVPWPGSASGGWPGWELVNGVWVETGGNFAWTRGAITAVIQVNPEVTVPLAYPPAGAPCAAPTTTTTTTTTSTSSDPLAATGSSFNAVPVLFAAGGLIVIGGLTLLIIRRRAARRL